MASTSSGLFTLDIKDVLKGAIVSTISAVLTFILPILQSGELKFDWKMIGGVALATFLAYLLKNLGTPSSATIPVDKETAKAIQAGEAKVTIQSTPK